MAGRGHTVKLLWYVWETANHIQLPCHEGVLLGDAHKNLKQTRRSQAPPRSKLLLPCRLPLRPLLAEPNRASKRCFAESRTWHHQASSRGWVQSQEPKLALSRLFCHSLLLSYFPQTLSNLVSGRKSKAASTPLRTFQYLTLINSFQDLWISVGNRGEKLALNERKVVENPQRTI